MPKVMQIHVYVCIYVCFAKFYFLIDSLGVAHHAVQFYSPPVSPYPSLTPPAHPRKKTKSMKARKQRKIRIKQANKQQKSPSAYLLFTFLITDCSFALFRFSCLLTKGF